MTTQTRHNEINIIHKFYVLGGRDMYRPHQILVYGRRDV